jgi:hypothetical protein
LLENSDGKIEFYENEKSVAVKIIFFATATGGGFYQLKRLVLAAGKLLLVKDKNLLYGAVLKEESEIYPFQTKRLLRRNLELKNGGLSRLHHLYLKLGVKTIGENLIA